MIYILNKTMKIKKIENLNRKGFTLVEVMVALFVFALVMTATSVTFTKAFRVYSDAKDVQENMENAQYAMNLMAKTFRTSSVASSDGTFDSVTVFDYSQAVGPADGKCIRYYFDSVNNRIMKSENNAPNLTSCGSAAQPTGLPITSGNIVAAEFDVRSSSAGSVVGKVTFSMKLKKGKSEVDIQTTTSLRDYVESEISL